MGHDVSTAFACSAALRGQLNGAIDNLWWRRHKASAVHMQRRSLPHTVLAEHERFGVQAPRKKHVTHTTGRQLSRANPPTKQAAVPKQAAASGPPPQTFIISCTHCFAYALWCVQTKITKKQSRTPHLMPDIPLPLHRLSMSAYAPKDHERLCTGSTSLHAQS